jgi:hypothetical protein
MSAIDHKTEALGFISGPSGIDWSEEAPHVEIAMAQVHATLYAAEQQRAANLIALAQVEQSGPFYELMGDSRRAALDAIREGLGLA